MDDERYKAMQNQVLGLAEVVRTLQKQVLEIVEVDKILSSRFAKLENDNEIKKKISKLERDILLLSNSIKTLSPTMSEEGKIEAQEEINKMVQEDQMRETAINSFK